MTTAASIYTWIIILLFWLLGFAFVIAGELLPSLFLISFSLLFVPFFNIPAAKKLNLKLLLSAKAVIGVLLLAGFGAALFPLDHQLLIKQLEPKPQEEQAAAVDTTNNLQSDPQPGAEDVIDETVYYPVTSVTDGDTIIVLIGNQTQTVRLVNMDAPETVDPRKPVECMGQEASQQRNSYN